MPTYDFRCVKCGHVREQRYQSYAAMQIATDWGCGEPSSTQKRCTGFMERLPSAPAFTVTGFNAKNGYSK